MKFAAICFLVVLGSVDLQSKVDDLLSEKAFDHSVFKDKKSGKDVKYADLPDFNKKIVYITAMEKMTRFLQTKQDETKDDEKVKDIYNLRKRLATAYEATAEDFFKRYASKFSSEESQGYLRQMRRYHNAHALIERKK
jgi:hypothetical protein